MPAAGSCRKQESWQPSLVAQYIGSINKSAEAKPCIHVESLGRCCWRVLLQLHNRSRNRDEETVPCVRQCSDDCSPRRSANWDDYASSSYTRMRLTADQSVFNPGM